MAANVSSQVHEMHSSAHDPLDDDRDIVGMWLRADPKRWVAGALAGLFAGVLSAAFAAVFAKFLGVDPQFPIKFAALPILGENAMRFDNSQALIVGLLTHEALCVFLGIVYAHFTAVNALPALLGAGLIWGTFSWIFISNLFVQAFTDIAALNLPKGVFLPVNLVFGLALASTGFFDRQLRGK
jgi:hypothetical protein